MLVALTIGKNTYKIDVEKNDTIKKLYKLASMKCLKNEKDIKLYLHGIELKDMDKELELKDGDVIVVHIVHELKRCTKAM